MVVVLELDTGPQVADNQQCANQAEIFRPAKASFSQLHDSLSVGESQQTLRREDEEENHHHHYEGSGDLGLVGLYSGLGRSSA